MPMKIPMTVVEVEEYRDAEFEKKYMAMTVGQRRGYARRMEGIAWKFYENYRIGIVYDWWEQYQHKPWILERMLRDFTLYELEAMYHFSDTLDDAKRAQLEEDANTMISWGNTPC